MSLFHGCPSVCARHCPGISHLGRWRHFPERADRHSAQALPEGEGLLPGIQHKSRDEVVAQSLRQVMEAAEVLLAHGGSGFDLDADYLARPAFQHGVDLDLVFRTIMEKLS